MNRCKRNTRRAANFIIEIASKKEGHKWSRMIIGKRFGISEATVKRLIKLLSDLGLIISKQLFKKPNAYYFGPNCFNGFFRQSLIKYLPALGLIFNIAFLFSKPSDDPHNIYKESSQKISAFRLYKKDRYYQNNYQIKQLEMLQEHLENVFPQKRNIMQLKSLKLTAYGSAKLSAFPAEAVQQADKKLATALRKKAVGDPFGYLCKVAMLWCKDRNINPDWRKVALLVEDQNLSEEMPKFEMILIQEQKATDFPLEESGRRYPTFDHRKQEEDLAVFYAEQAEWDKMDDALRKDFLRPFVYKLCERKHEVWAQRYCPFNNARHFIDELIVEFYKKAEAKADKADLWNIKPIQEQQSIWAPLIPQLAILTPERRAHYLKKSGCDYAIDIVEQLVADYVKKETTHADGHISNQR